MRKEEPIQKLSQEDLLASVISRETVKELSKQYGSVQEALWYSSQEELEKIKGIGTIKARQLRCITELAKRFYQMEYPLPKQIKNPKDIFRYAQDMRYLEVEEVRVMYLNTKNGIKGTERVFIGNLSSCIVTPREVYCRAVRMRAAGIILIHNHPSGIAEPSQEDIDITKQLAMVGKVVGIALLDHVIIGKNDYVSLSERGKI